MGAVPSRGAVIAQYGLGAALSCDALGWKQAVGRCSAAAPRAVGLRWEGPGGDSCLGKEWFNILKEVDTVYNVTELKVWGRDG